MTNLSSLSLLFFNQLFTIDNFVFFSLLRSENVFSGDGSHQYLGGWARQSPARKNSRIIGDREKPIILLIVKDTSILQLVKIRSVLVVDEEIRVE